VDGRGNVCLADFGLSNLLEGVISSVSSRSSGSIRWMAPELFKTGHPRTRRSLETDIYAFSGLMMEASLAHNFRTPCLCLTHSLPGAGRTYAISHLQERPLGYDGDLSRGASNETQLCRRAHEMRPARLCQDTRNTLGLYATMLVNRCQDATHDLRRASTA
jgi:serine/threonine protein kinase